MSEGILTEEEKEAVKENSHYFGPSKWGKIGVGY